MVSWPHSMMIGTPISTKLMIILHQQLQVVACHQSGQQTRLSVVRLPRLLPMRFSWSFRMSTFRAFLAIHQRQEVQVYQ